MPAGHWRWGRIPAYNLSEETLNSFLKSKFGNHIFYIEHKLDHLRFWAPRDLTESEEEKLLARRERSDTSIPRVSKHDSASSDLSPHGWLAASFVEPEHRQTVSEIDVERVKEGEGEEKNEEEDAVWMDNEDEDEGLRGRKRERPTIDNTSRPEQLKGVPPEGRYASSPMSIIANAGPSSWDHQIDPTPYDEDESLMAESSEWGSQAGTDTTSLAGSITIPDGARDDFVVFFSNLLHEHVESWVEAAALSCSRDFMQEVLEGLLKQYSISASLFAEAGLQKRFTMIIRRDRQHIARSFTEQCYLKVQHTNTYRYLNEFMKQEISDKQALEWDLDTAARRKAIGKVDNDAYDIEIGSLMSFLVDDGAFWRLQCDLRNHVYYNTGGIMETIKEEVFDKTVHSQTTLDSNIVARFNDFGGGVFQFMQDQYEEGQSLAQMLVLVGTAEQAYTVPCLKYMRDTWPRSGQATLEFLDTALRADSHELEYSTGPVTSICLSSRPRSLDGVTQRSLNIRVEASRLDLVEIAQQFWLLTANFRPPVVGALCESEAWMSSMVSDGNVQFRLFLDSLEPLSKNRSSCWHHLFAGSVIARGFPIPSRSRQVGIEIPYPLMVSLARVQYPVEFKRGVLLKGFSTMLLPTSSTPDSVQWHFVSSHGNKHLPTASLKDRLTCTFRIEDLNNISKKRAFLGFCRKVKVLFGTRSVDYDRVGHSTYARRIGTKLSLDGITAGFTAAAHGIPGRTINANIKLSKNRAMIKDRDKEDFAGILEDLRSRPMILYDVDIKKSWLVPAIGVVLHMIHLFARKRPELFQHNGKTIEPPFAKASWDSGRAALEVIEKDNALLELHPKPGTDAEPFRLMDLVGQLWGNLESAFESLENSQPTRHLFERSGTIRGWELMDMAFPQHPRPKESRLKRSGGGWQQLTNEVLTLFCSGLGDLIKADGTQQSCPGWSAVPPGKDYMIASVSSLMLLSATCGKAKDGHFRLTDGLCLHQRSSLEKFGDCSHGPDERCNIFQEIVAIQKSCLPPPGIETSIPHVGNCRFPKEGAVIIGKQTRLVKSRRAKTPHTLEREVDREEAYGDEQDQQPNATNGVDDHLHLPELRGEDMDMDVDDANPPPVMNQEAEIRTLIIR